MFVLCINRQKKIKREQLFEQNEDINPLLESQGHSRYEELHSAFDIPVDPITEDELNDTLEEVVTPPKRPHVVTYTEVSLDSMHNE